MEQTETLHDLMASSSLSWSPPPPAHTQKSPDLLDQGSSQALIQSQYFHFTFESYFFLF